MKRGWGVVIVILLIILVIRVEMRFGREILVTVANVEYHETESYARLRKSYEELQGQLDAYYDNFDLAVEQEVNDRIGEVR